MGRRLSRIKARIKNIGIAFEVPEESELSERMEYVLETIYAAYGQGWGSAGSDDQTRKGLTEEAIWLARVLLELRLNDAEALGLLSLMLFCESRRAAGEGTLCASGRAGDYTLGFADGARSRRQIADGWRTQTTRALPD